MRHDHTERYVRHAKGHTCHVEFLSLSCPRRPVVGGGDCGDPCWRVTGGTQADRQPWPSFWPNVASTISLKYRGCRWAASANPWVLGQFQARRWMLSSEISGGPRRRPLGCCRAPCRAGGQPGEAGAEGMRGADLEHVCCLAARPGAGRTGVRQLALATTFGGSAACSNSRWRR